MERFFYQIGAEDADERLDRWLVGTLSLCARAHEETGCSAACARRGGQGENSSLPDGTETEFSRSYLQKCISEGQVLVNDKPAKAGYRLRVEDEVCFFLPEPVLPKIEAQDIPLSILYEDGDVLVVDKPKGMVVHPAPGHFDGTLVNALLYHCKDQLSGINGVLRPGIVHRIDRDTTGSLLVCKNDRAHRSIAAQLKEHSLNRSYLCLVHGVMDADEGVIDLPIGRDEKERKRMAVNKKSGREAVTRYRVLARFRDYTYIECRLLTGRTHQIRVHMTALGHPLLGDEVYGKRKSPFSLQGQTLHAHTLGFTHPATGERVEVEAPLPDYFAHLLEILKKQ